MNVDDARLLAINDAIADRKLPPVHSWHPERTGDAGIQILRNGDWLYKGSRIDRSRMVKLFSTVLRKDDDGQIYLVTPQERLRIEVEDAPFTAVLLQQHGTASASVLVFTTNTGEQVIADSEHMITVRYKEPGGEPSPYLHVRDRLEALISRPVFYQLAELAVERDGVPGVISRGCFMPLSES